MYQINFNLLTQVNRYWDPHEWCRLLSQSQVQSAEMIRIDFTSSPVKTAGKQINVF